MFVVCTDIDSEQKVVLASISSWKNDLCDSTCKLDPGCHSFIKRASYVLYRESRIELAATLQAGLEKSLFIPLDDVEEKTLEKIIEGLSVSKFTPWWVKRHMKRIG
jgi:hypothetical protein